VHAQPEIALSDGKQALRPADFAQLMTEVRRLLPLFGRRLCRGAAAVAPASDRPGSGSLPTTLDDEVIAP
jgi:hypothetical protein